MNRSLFASYKFTKGFGSDSSLLNNVDNRAWSVQSSDNKQHSSRILESATAIKGIRRIWMRTICLKKKKSRARYITRKAHWIVNRKLHKYHLPLWGTLAALLGKKRMELPWTVSPDLTTYLLEDSRVRSDDFDAFIISLSSVSLHANLLSKDSIYLWCRVSLSV